MVKANDSFLVQPGEQKTYLVRLESTERLLLNRMTTEELLDLVRRVKPDPQAKIERSQFEAIAAKSLYRDEDNRLGLPADNLLACLRQAGTEIAWGARSKLAKVTHKSGKTMLFTFLRVNESFLVFIDLPDGGINNEGWVVDVRRGKKNTANPVPVIRPLVPKWAAEFTVTVTFIGPEVSEKMVKDLISLAGKEYGLGAFRPGLNRYGARHQKGPFGTFRLAKFAEISQPAQKASAVA
jgi:hypothetical protein